METVSAITFAQASTADTRKALAGEIDAMLVEAREVVIDVEKRIDRKTISVSDFQNAISRLELLREGVEQKAFGAKDLAVIQHASGAIDRISDLVQRLASLDERWPKGVSSTPKR